MRLAQRAVRGAQVTEAHTLTSCPHAAAPTRLTSDPFLPLYPPPAPDPLSHPLPTPPRPSLPLRGTWRLLLRLDTVTFFNEINRRCKKALIGTGIKPGATSVPQVNGLNLINNPQSQHLT